VRWGSAAGFSEGLTTYYTALAPMRAGFSSVEAYGEEINAAARGYWGSEARDWSAEKIARAGFGSESIRHVPYNRSALYFADLDAKIRAKSGGKRKLDDLLAPMFVSREQGVKFDHDAWKAMVGAELGPEAVATFEAVVLNGEMFTPEAGAFGPCFTREATTYKVGGGERRGLSVDAGGLGSRRDVPGLVGRLEFEHAGLVDGPAQGTGIARLRPPPAIGTEEVRCGDVGPRPHDHRLEP
jgi:predicted metalloprotease with PDZ domain